MDTKMQTEKIAALIWRFIAVWLIATALPGLLLSLQPLAALLGYPGIGPNLPAMFLPMSLLLLQVIVGILILRFSRELGSKIARGL
jgi:hypothetical protein